MQKWQKREYIKYTFKLQNISYLFFFFLYVIS